MSNTTHNMTVDFSQLESIPIVIKKLDRLEERLENNVDKTWLNVKELSEYIGHSIHTINKMVKEKVFIDGLHYHKPSKKLLFRRQAIDNWVLGIEENRVEEDYDIDEILKSWEREYLTEK